MANLLKKAVKWILTWFPVAWYKICREQIYCILMLVMSIGMFIVWEALYRDGSVLGGYNGAVIYFMSAEYVEMLSPIFILTRIYSLRRQLSSLAVVILVMFGMETRAYIFGADIWRNLVTVFVISVIYVIVMNYVEEVANHRGFSLLQPGKVLKIKYNVLNVSQYMESRKAEKKGVSELDVEKEQGSEGEEKEAERAVSEKKL